MIGKHRRPPPEIIVEQTAAHVVDVVSVAIVGEANRNDRFERGRTPRRDLQRVEPAPGFADDRDGAVAPVLRRDPGDRLQRVVLLELQIFVFEPAVRIAGAADVDAHRGVTVRGEIAVHRLVSSTRAVPFAVGDIFKRRRRWSQLFFRQP